MNVRIPLAYFCRMQLSGGRFLAQMFSRAQNNKKQEFYN